MIEFILNLIYTSGNFLYTFMVTNILTPENLAMLLAELQYLFGSLQDFLRDVDIASLSYIQKLWLIAALESLSITFYFLATFLEGSTEPTLIVCRGIALGIHRIIRAIIHALRGY